MTGWAGTAIGQTQLPAIVVTTPSPVTQKPAAPAPTAPSTAPSSTPASAAADAPGDTALSPTLSSPPGSIIVVDDAFVPVTIATSREIQATQGATITETLMQKPGISGSSFAAGANRPIIRGLDNARVRVQENGIGSHDVSTLSEDHAVPIDPYAADRVEVVRGPATLRYGSQAIGGVVAVENNRIPSFVPPRGFTAEIVGGLSSMDEGRDGAVTVTAGAAGFVVHADTFRRHTEDYGTPKGRQLNTFVNSDGFSVGLSRVWSNGFVGVSFTRFASLYGVPGEEAAEARPRIDMEQDKVQARGEWRPRAFGVEAMRFWFGSSDYTHDEVVFDDDPLVDRDIIGTRFINKEVEARLEIEHLPVMTRLGEMRGAIGVQAGRRKTRGFGVEEPVDGLLDPSTTRTIAAFWFEELQMTERLRFQAAARIESTKVRGLGYSDISDPLAPEAFDGERAFKPISGSLGLLYKLPAGVVARLTGQYVERAPEAGELFSKGVHEATGTFEIGNPNLTKEKATTIELGFKKATGSLRFDSSVYHTKFNGFVFKQLTGVECGDAIDACGVEDELDQVLFQQRKATFTGAEIAAQYDVAQLWRGVWGIEGQYDFVRARFSGDNVPRIPPHRLGGGVYYRDANWFARAGLLRAFDQKKVNAESDEMATPGYTLVSAELAYTTKLEPGLGNTTEMTIGIRGENLANDDVLNHASFKRREEVYQPGASVRVFGKLRFN